MKWIVEKFFALAQIRIGGHQMQTIFLTNSGYKIQHIFECFFKHMFFNHCIFCRQTEVELKKKHDQSSNSRKKIVGGHGRWLAWRAKKGSNHLH